MNTLKVFKRMITILFIFIFTIGVLNSCTTSQPVMRISNYRYDFEENNFRIRSVNCELKEECFNELIGGDFLAVDLNQDRIIDRIVMGETDLAEAQRIYEFGLDLLAKEHKLEEHRTEVTQYQEMELCCSNEIKSFHVRDADTFNEFILTENRETDNPVITVAIDQEADGKLDTIIKGSAALEVLQVKYAAMISAGLETGRMIKINETVFVKRI